MPAGDPELAKASGTRSAAKSAARRALGGKRACKLVPLPGPAGAKGEQVGLWVLRDDEVARARAAAMHYLLDDCKLDSLKLSLDPSIYEEELGRQMLALALRDAEQPEASWAEDAAELRLLLEPDMREALLRAYNAHADERSPLTRAKTEEEVRKLLAVLGEEQTASSYLSYCDTDTLRSIAIELASRLTALMKQSSSGTSPSS